LPVAANLLKKPSGIFLIGLQRTNFRPSMPRNIREPAQYDKLQKMKKQVIDVTGENTGWICAWKNKTEVCL